MIYNKYMPNPTLNRSGQQRDVPTGKGHQRARLALRVGALIIEKYGRFHSCKCHAAQSNKLPPISFALCVMKGRRHRACGRWRPRLALAQHVAQPGRPNMPVRFVVAGSRAPVSWTLGALIIERYGHYNHANLKPHNRTNCHPFHSHSA